MNFVLSLLQSNPKLVASLLRVLADEIEKDPTTVTKLLSSFGVKLPNA